MGVVWGAGVVESRMKAAVSRSSFEGGIWEVGSLKHLVVVVEGGLFGVRSWGRGRGGMKAGDGFVEVCVIGILLRMLVVVGW